MFLQHMDFSKKDFSKKGGVLLPPSKLLFIENKSVCSILFLSMLDDNMVVDDV